MAGRAVYRKMASQFGDVAAKGYLYGNGLETLDAQFRRRFNDTLLRLKESQTKYQQTGLDRYKNGISRKEKTLKGIAGDYQNAVSAIKSGKWSEGHLTITETWIDYPGYV